MEKNIFQPIRLIVYDLKQDDPKKCTSKKLIRFGLAIPLSKLRQIPRTAIVLNPFSDIMLLSTDVQLAPCIRPGQLQYPLPTSDLAWPSLLHTCESLL